MANNAFHIPGFSCSSGWRITGYYLPSEGDFGAPTVSIVISGWKTDDFPIAFLNACKMEGWGETRYGWFLGWSGHGWIKAEYAQDARGGRLAVGCIAVDKDCIHLGSAVRIPSAPPPWDTQAFMASDTGGAINGKHVDIFCGVGEAARMETYRVTGDSGTVCVGE
jgi:3D (Asp-Asp-Asp) domain-containing protein